MNHKKNVTYPVPSAHRANTQSSQSPTTEQGKSYTRSSPSQQGVTAKRGALPVALAGHLRPKSDVPKERTNRAEANRKNALKSTGPKTPRGKRHSRSNARKHGLYSKELLVSEVESPEFEEMRLGLEAQLQPSTTLRWLAFDYVVVCHWRCKLALRIERPQFARQFQDEQSENERGEAPDIDPVIEYWYGSGRAATRAGIRLLENAMEEFEANGAFREETKAFLTRGFGADFVRLLEEWKPMNRDAVLLADHLESKRKSFGEEFGEVSNTDVRTSSGLGETAKVVLDPMQCQQMVGKLLEERRNILNELLIIAERNMFEGKRGAVQSCDFNPRFLADANRELQRALDRYFSLKDRGL
jgi:hypothetical protein